MKIVTSEQMQKIDGAAILSGISRERLMENAGRAVFKIISKVYAPIKTKKVLILCAKGNNTGDGLVAARYLMQKGGKVSFCFLEDPALFKGETLENYKKLFRESPSESLFDQTRFRIPELIRCLKKEIQKTDLIIDALFGTGLNANIKGKYKTTIELVNKSQKPVISIDIPSGVNGTTGDVMGVAVMADFTVTFGLPKVGFFLPPGIDYVGKLFIQNIGFPKRLLNHTSHEASLIDANILKKIPKRKKSAHKGSGGHVLVFAGSPGKCGAAIMTVQAAFRTGSGLVTLLTHPKSQKEFLKKAFEAFLDTYDQADFELQKYLKDKKAIAFGPGIGVTETTKKLLHFLIQKNRKPIIIDADGLTLLAQDLKILKQKKDPLILTPHPGEMARLVKKTVKEVQKNRLQISKTFAKKHGVYLILKGAATVIATPNGKLYINPTGNPVMATAGMGDVLTGMLLSFLGQGLGVETACQLAVYAHGKIADLWAEKKKTTRGFMASDLIREIPKFLG